MGSRSAVRRDERRRRWSPRSSRSSTCATAAWSAMRRWRGRATARRPRSCSPRARAEGRLAEVDRACRAAALRDAAAAGLGAPFALFLNADAGALELDLPDLPHGGATLVMEITETRADRAPGGGAAHADAAAHARLGRVARRRRRRLALAGGDAAALSRRDQARPAAARRARAARRRARRHRGRRRGRAPARDRARRGHRLRGAARDWRAPSGATLGQGFLLGEPGPLPDPLPDARAGRCGWRARAATRPARCPTSA